jgi:lipopolysaccharide transport system permease protein
MARFNAVQAQSEGEAIRVRFTLDAPGPGTQVVGWQLYDPDSGAFLFEGEWQEATPHQAGHADVDLSVTLPPDDGPYRIQVAPVEDRARFILIDAHVGQGRVSIHPPRVTTQSRERRARTLAAIPKAFVYPISSIWKNHKLMASMVQRDILARYRGSFGGALWTFLNPLLLMLTYFFVFGVVLNAKLGTDTSRTGFVLYLLAGMLPWLAFAEAVGRSPSIILEHRNFVKKLVFPIETLPVNIVISGAVTEAFGLLVFLVALLLARGAIPATLAWIPALLIPQLMLTAGICWFLAGLGVYMRDLGQIMGFILTLWFFLTPICYPEPAPGQIPETVARILRMNPIYVLVRGYRMVLLEHQPPHLFALGVLWIVSAAAAVCGYAWFHRLRKSFADVI